MIRVGAELRALARARHELDAVIEHAREQRLLLAKRLEMRRLRRGLQMPGPLVVARDRLVGDQTFQRVNRIEGEIEEPARAGFAEPRDERLRIELHPGEHLPAVPRARAPSDVLPLEHDHGRAGARTCRAAARPVYPAPTIATSTRAGSAGRRRRRTHELRHRVPPVGILFHRRAPGSAIAAAPSTRRLARSCTNATTFTCSRCQAGAIVTSVRAAACAGVASPIGVIVRTTAACVRGGRCSRRRGPATAIRFSVTATMMSARSPRDRRQLRRGDGHGESIGAGCLDRHRHGGVRQRRRFAIARRTAARRCRRTRSGRPRPSAACRSNRPRVPGRTLLALRQRRRRKAILPAEPIPVVDVLAERDHFRAGDRLTLDETLEQGVRWRTTRTPFRREELDEHRRRPRAACGAAHAVNATAIPQTRNRRRRIAQFMPPTCARHTRSTNASRWIGSPAN